MSADDSLASIERDLDRLELKAIDYEKVLFAFAVYAGIRDQYGLNETQKAAITRAIELAKAEFGDQPHVSKTSSTSDKEHTQQ
jgi:hypothetical protein